LYLSSELHGVGYFFLCYTTSHTHDQIILGGPPVYLLVFVL
jgi:hypothetical protein